MNKLIVALFASLFSFAASAAPVPASAAHVGKDASVISERTITVDGKPALEVVAEVWKTGEVVRFVQATSMFTQGPGSRVVINMEPFGTAKVPPAVNVD
jgi:hypothetical protein